MNSKGNILYKVKVWFKRICSGQKMLGSPQDEVAQCETKVDKGEKGRYIELYTNVKKGNADLSMFSISDLKRAWLMLKEEAKIKENKIEQLTKNDFYKQEVLNEQKTEVLSNIVKDEYTQEAELLCKRVKNGDVDVSKLSIADLKNILARLEKENSNIKLMIN